MDVRSANSRKRVRRAVVPRQAMSRSGRFSIGTIAVVVTMAIAVIVVMAVFCPVAVSVPAIGAIGSCAVAAVKAIGGSGED